MLRVPISHFQVQDYIVYVTGNVSSLQAGLSPVRPSLPKVTFHRTSSMALPNIKGLVTPAPLPSGNPDHVLSRRCDVGLAGADGTQLPVVTVDVSAGPAQFDAVIGQTYSITDTDTNSVGDSLPSLILAGTVALPATVPATPGAPTVSFFDPDAVAAATAARHAKK